MLSRASRTAVVCLLALAPAGCRGPARAERASDLLRQPDALLQPTAGPRETVTLPESPSLSDYLRLAALNNPGLEAAFDAWKAALERVPQVEALPDPRFTYRCYIEEVETRVGPQEQAFGLSQTFPWFGKLALKGEVALQEANAARQRYEAAKRKLFYRVQHSYAEYYYLGRAIAVVERTRNLMERLESVVRTRYRAASAEHADVMRAQVELGKLEDRLRTLRDLRGAVAARLNAALDLPSHTELPWPAALPEEPIEAADEDVLSWCAEASPELLAMGHETVRREREVALARKDYWPDVTLGLDYIDTGGARMPGVSDSGKDPVSAIISVNVPLWLGKRRAAEREARMQHRAALNARAERANVLLSEVKMALYQMHDAERKMGLYRDTLLPKARQSMAVTETAFRAGRADFGDLVDAERVLLEFELSYERALAERVQRLAEVEMLVGRDLPRRATPAAAVPAPVTSETAAGGGALE